VCLKRPVLEALTAPAKRGTVRASPPGDPAITELLADLNIPGRVPLILAAICCNRPGLGALADVFVKRRGSLVRTGSPAAVVELGLFLPGPPGAK